MIFGVWGICVFLGGILGSLISVEARIFFGWQYVFLVSSVIVGAIGVPVLQFLRMPTGTTQRPILHVVSPSKASSSSALPVDGLSSPSVAPGALGPPVPTRPAELVVRADAFSQSDRAMTAEEEQAVVSSGVYVIDSMPPARLLSVTEVAKIDMVKEVAGAYFCVNVIRYLFIHV